MKFRYFSHLMKLITLLWNFSQKSLNGLYSLWRDGLFSTTNYKNSGLLSGIIRQLRIISRKSSSQISEDLISLTGLTADFIGAINSLPHKFLWAGKLSPRQSAFSFLVASVIGFYKCMWNANIVGFFVLSIFFKVLSWILHFSIFVLTFTLLPEIERRFQ